MPKRELRDASATDTATKLRRVLEKLEEHGANRSGEAGLGVFAAAPAGRRHRVVKAVPVGPRHQAELPRMDLSSTERGDVLLFSPAWGHDSHACDIL